MINTKFDCGIKRIRTRAAAARMALLASTALCLSLAAAEPVMAQGETETDASEQGKEFNIPPSDMGKALDAYAEQADVEIIYSDRDVAGKLSNGVHGTYPRDAALDELIGNSGLKYTVNEDGVVVIQAASLEVKDAAAARPMMRVAEAGKVEKAAISQSEAGGADRERDNVIVTGTRIKGVKDQFSPVTQISREEMDLAGFASVADAVDAIPQNFGGGVTIDTSVGGAGTGPGGASVNLRGLGNQATLILLNGRRLAAGGVFGDFVDISSIPTTAIERVDVLTDGASAIYGSDAIAGVVNIILRDDFNGAETRVNVGTITDGGGDYLKVGQTLGWSGDRAHAVVSYEFSDEEELDATDKDFAANTAQPTWLLPFTQKHSIFASAGAKPTDVIKISADGYFNDRKTKQFSARNTNGILAQEFSTAEVQQYGGAVGLDIAIGSEWEASLSGSYSKSDHTNNSLGAGPLATKGFTSTQTEVLSFDGSIGGPLLSFAATPIRGVAGLHYREETATILLTSLNGGGGNVLIDVDKSRHVIAGFGEIYAPIVSEGDGGRGVESLALNAAVRYEKYSDSGSSFDPKFGLSWSPLKGLNLRGTFGKSFRAPRLDQQVDSIVGAILGIYVDPLAVDGESVALNITGFRDDLGPERSRTWSAGFDFSPPWLDSVLLRGTYFNTEFRNQVGAPTRETDTLFRFTDFTGIPIRDITPAEALDYCARATVCFNYGDYSFLPGFGHFAGLSYDDVEVLLDARQQNLSLSRAAGLDFEGRYVLPSAVGDWRFSLAGTLLTAFEMQVAPAALVDELLNSFGNPVDLKLRGGVEWRSDTVSSALFVNYIGDYVDDELPDGDAPIKSFTTVDATIRLDLGELSDTALTDGATLSFSIINLFNREPPFITPFISRAAIYDPANANPAGRKVGILLTKRW